MSEPKIVYGYLDLAEPAGHGSTAAVVPLSDGTVHQFVECVDYIHEHLLSALHASGKRIEAVRGAEALRVAEREVADAANERNTYREPIVAVEFDRQQPDELLLRWRDGKNGRWLTCNQPRLSRAVDIRDQLRARLANAKPQDADHHRAVVAVRAVGTCRICGRAPECGPGLPFVYDFGREHAHEACLKRIGDNRIHGEVVHVTLDTSKAVAALKDVRKLAEEVGRNVRESMKREEKPMAIVNLRGSDDPKPDPHAECRLRLQDADVVDDYGRKLWGVTSIRFDHDPSRAPGIEIRVMHDPNKPDGARPPATATDPLVIDVANVSPSEAARYARELSEKTGRHVVALPHRVHLAERSVNDVITQLSRDNVPRDVVGNLTADIDRRADLGAAYKRGKHVGLVFGACLLIGMLGMLAVVAHYRPSLACRAVLWLAGGR